MEKLENLTALDIVDLVKSRKITCREITEYYLAKIEEYKESYYEILRERGKIN